MNQIDCVINFINSIAFRLLPASHPELGPPTSLQAFHHLSKSSVPPSILFSLLLGKDDMYFKKKKKLGKELDQEKTMESVIFVLRKSRN